MAQLRRDTRTGWVRILWESEMSANLSFAKNWLLISFVVGTCWATGLFAQEADPTADSPAKPIADAPAGNSANDTQKLVQDLDATDFADRQAASQKLAEMGTHALPALEKAAQGSSREAVQRSLDLIRKLFQSEDLNTKKQAEEALKRLAESESPSIASRAKAILSPPDSPNDPNVPGVPAIPLQIQGGIIQIQANGIGNGVKRRMTVRNNNGVREIEADEEGRSVKIKDDPNQGIKIEITEKKDGKEETKKYEAKNAEELKKNHPEAHKVYEEFSKQGNPIKIQAFGGPIAVPNAIPGIPAGIPGVNPQEINKHRLQGTERALEGVQRAIDQLQLQKQRLLDEKARLERELAPPAETPEKQPAAESITPKPAAE